MFCLPKIKNEYDLKCRLGNTQYIDFLFPNEIPYNKMKGRDLFERSFIILKIGILNLKTGDFIKKGQVFFQSYSPTSLTHPSYFYNWQAASLDGEFINTDRGLTTPQIQLITDIVNNKLILLNEDHFPTNFSLGDCLVIASMDYWEDRAARTIQKYFLKARYNPNYKICQHVLNRQYDEYNEVMSI